jgi:hypothetical protein
MKPELLKRLAEVYETVVEKQFRKLGFSVTRLDRQKKRPRPEFLVSRSGRPQMLCEVKAIFSSGYRRDKGKGFHISTLDENLGPFTLYRKEIRRTQIDDCLSDAVRKRDALVTDKRAKNEVTGRIFEKLPLLVAFFFDFFADHLHLYPRTFNKDVSGILTIKRDDATIKAFEELRPADQERLLFDPNWEAGLPTSGKVFVLVRNKAARRKVPRDFQYYCRTERYDEPPIQLRGGLALRR